MANGNPVGANPDFFDQESYDFLPLRDVERLGTRLEARPKVGERFTQTKTECRINGGRLDRLQLRRDRVLLRAERRHPRP